MTNFDRRQFVAGAAAITAAGACSSASAHENKLPIGAWTPLADHPFPVQEIYPAPFWRDSISTNTLKPQPFNIVVSAGGLTPGTEYNVTDRVTYYDPVTNIWGAGTRLPAPRHHIALVNNNGLLYAIGGFARDNNGGWQMRANCWRLGDVLDDWDYMAQMPYPQAESVCASLGGFIHVAGGRSPSGSLNREWANHIDTDEHWIYDAASDRWEPLAPMLTARNSAAGAVVNGVMYVIGGRTVSDGNTNKVEVYDPLSDRWENARPLPQAASGLAAAVINRKIYVFGGEYFSPGTGGAYAEAWEYDPRSDKWRAVAAMPRRRHGLGAVSMNNTIYVIGGAVRAGGNGTSSAVDRFEI
ncbi:MAG: galactose oxidase [Marinicaulis sp.]|nr:galactose oxidase [Marinicaulis sp.]